MAFLYRPLNKHNSAPDGGDAATQKLSKREAGFASTVHSLDPVGDARRPAAPSAPKRLFSLSINWKTYVSRAFPSTIVLPTAIAIVILPIIGFATWIPSNVRNGGQMGLSSVAIGGRLTQIQAKVIDVLCSALFSPVLVYCLNWYWFTTARVTVINERTSGGVPLTTLIEASKTDSGSYNPNKILKLARSKKPKIYLLVLLVLLSAIVHSAFSNVIAYEAYLTAGGSTFAKLRALNNFERFPFPVDFQPYPYNFTEEEQSKFSGQVIGMLTEMAYHNATDKLASDSYIGINATRASMDSLPSTITDLHDVPGYRLSIVCWAQPPDQVSVVAMGGYKVQINAVFNTGNGSALMYQAAYPGQMDVLTSAYNEEYTYLGFTLDQAQAYLGNLASFPTFKDPIPSPYGNITYKTYNMDASGFSGTKQKMSSWGLRCNVTRETGLHNLIRQTDLSWKITDSTWQGSKQATKLLIGDWQLALNFHAPTKQGFEPGLAPAFQSSATVCPTLLAEDLSCTEPLTDYRVNTLNFLYAAGETERIAYEIKNAVPAGGNGFFQVQAKQSELRYRMTYVPLILLIGLLSVLGAALISFALVFFSRHTTSFRTWRDVDSLRLVVDSVDGLRHEPVLRSIHCSSNTEMERWAQEFTVRYLKEVVDSKMAIKLSRFSKH